MKKVSALLFAVLYALLLALPALASSVKSPTGDYVSDFAGVLSAEAKEHINRNAKALDDATGAQIVFVTLDTTEPASIGDYAFKLFNTWKIGDAKKNNGILVLLAIGDDNYYTMEGTGLERNLPPEELSALWNEYLEPDFAAKDYSSASVKYFDALLERVSTIYGAGHTVSGKSQTEKTTDGNSAAFVIILILVLGIAIVVAVTWEPGESSDGSGNNNDSLERYRRSWSAGNSDGSYSRRESSYSASSSNDSTGYSGGGIRSGGGRSSSSGGFSGGGGESRGAGGGRGR